MGDNYPLYFQNPIKYSTATPPHFSGIGCQIYYYPRYHHILFCPLFAASLYVECYLTVYLPRSNLKLSLNSRLFLISQKKIYFQFSKKYSCDFNNKLYFAILYCWLHGYNRKVLTLVMGSINETSVSFQHQ